MDKGRVWMDNFPFSLNIQTTLFSVKNLFINLEKVFSFS